MSVARAEIQKQEAERRYTEVACTNRHIVIQSMEREIAEALSTESNGINLLQVLSVIIGTNWCYVPVCSRTAQPTSCGSSGQPTHWRKYILGPSSTPGSWTSYR